MSLSVYTHPACLEHFGFPFFAEKPGRLATLNALFNEMTLPVIEPAINDDTLSVVSRIHDPDYISEVWNISLEDKLTATVANIVSPYVQWYTRVSPGSFDAAMHAVEVVRKAVEDTLEGKCRRAFCAIRPPGHHAAPARGEGFCLFNNIAAGAAAALDKGLSRVAIVDFDQHHGNGTQAIIEHHKMDNVLFISSYQEGCKYNRPEQRGRIASNILTVPLRRGENYKEVESQYRAHIIPALYDFQPELILVSAGFDLHKADPLSKIKLESADYESLTGMLTEAADELCGGRIVSALEGGYDQPALKECVRHHLTALQR